MDLDAMLAEAAPARRASLDAPDSPAAISLSRRITALPAAPVPALRRHRLPVLGLAGAVAAAAAVALTAIPGSPALAAWRVSKNADGLVTVTIQQLRDPAGLARRLRADGVPANVVFLTHHFQPTTSPSAIPAPCQAPHISDAVNASLQAKILPDPPVGGTLAIRPSAIPHGLGVFVEAYAAPGTAGAGNNAIQTDLELASPQCTGS
ncbi:MAG TPA: hypothetical protein VK599_01395 [Streptosporangiaceae bacterium]|nr:hypothetical protein [Streptosporangiaceae bacterium]